MSHSILHGLMTESGSYAKTLVGLSKVPEQRPILYWPPPKKPQGPALHTFEPEPQPYILLPCRPVFLRGYHPAHCKILDACAHFRFIWLPSSPHSGLFGILLEVDQAVSHL